MSTACTLMRLKVSWMMILEMYFTLDNLINIFVISSGGNHSLIVPWLSFQWSMYGQSKTSFFLIKSIGKAPGEDDSHNNPFSRLLFSYSFWASISTCNSLYQGLNGGWKSGLRWIWLLIPGGFGSSCHYPSSKKKIIILWWDHFLSFLYIKHCMILTSGNGVKVYRK
jgi:hypothetical protein